VIALALGAAGALAYTPRPPGAVASVATGTLAVLVVAPVAVVLALRWLRPPTSAFMARARRRRRRSGEGPIAHEWVDYEGIAPAMRLAAIAAEDSYFALHHGFDWESIRSARTRNREGAAVRGGSTISQQVAKNLFLWPARSYLRKTIEAYFTVLIEALWPKRRTLEIYLNIAQFGPGVFGVAAAARALAGKEPTALTRQEAALLAAVLPSPARYQADRPTPFVRLRQVLILDNMKRLGDRYLEYL
jgi:monofunctional biosynthetic peptidoglycan transglycosylase